MNGELLTKVDLQQDYLQLLQPSILTIPVSVYFGCNRFLITFSYYHHFISLESFNYSFLILYISLLQVAQVILEWRVEQ